MAGSPWGLRRLHPCRLVVVGMVLLGVLSARALVIDDEPEVVHVGIRESRPLVPDPCASGQAKKAVVNRSRIFSTKFIDAPFLRHVLRAEPQGRFRVERESRSSLLEEAITKFTEGSKRNNEVHESPLRQLRAVVSCAGKGRAGFDGASLRAERQLVKSRALSLAIGVLLFAVSKPLTESVLFTPTLYLLVFCAMLFGCILVMVYWAVKLSREFNQGARWRSATLLGSWSTLVLLVYKVLDRQAENLRISILFRVIQGRESSSVTHIVIVVIFFIVIVAVGAAMFVTRRFLVDSNTSEAHQLVRVYSRFVMELFGLMCLLAGSTHPWFGLVRLPLRTKRLPCAVFLSGKREEFCACE